MHSEETVRAALELARRGRSATEIADETGLNRRTISDWLRGRTPRLRPAVGAFGSFASLPPEYLYLLGLYLGDGCLSPHPREVYKLRIVLDLAYPDLIRDCEGAIRAVLPGIGVGRAAKAGRCLEVFSYSKAWPYLFPQHGPGKKHQRRIALAPWQDELASQQPKPLLRGLIHSDGHRFINTGRGGWTAPRYGFTNHSEGIRQIFCDTCDLLGLHWTRSGKYLVYVSRKADVARMDEFIGPKS